jgi:Mrp family chromosome partitioning ATPase
MASFKGGGAGDSGGGGGKDVRDTDEFDTRRTHVFDRGPDGALVPVVIPPTPPPYLDKLPVGPPPREMAAQTQIEAFRELRTKLLQLAAAQRLHHFTTLVVPIAADSGASFVARNLAAAFALQEHQSAVLIDCDFRSPTQHIVLGRPAQAEGLSDFLDETMALPSFQQPPVLLDRLLAPTGLPGLRIVAAGRCEAVRAGRPREYFSSNAMRQLMYGLRDLATYVVIDGPPLDASPDARILSLLADLVVLVVAYGQVSHADVVKASETFERSKLAGVVFNDRAAGPKPKKRRRA